MAKIILTEKQVSYIFQKSLIKEGFKKTANTMTAGQKITNLVIPAERKLEEMGMSLFADPSFVSLLPQVAYAIDNGEMVLRWKPRMSKKEQEMAKTDGVFLDVDNFADQEAFALVNQYIMGERFRGENKYAEALAKVESERLNQEAEAREQKKLVSRSDAQKAIDRNTAAKIDKYMKYFSSPEFTCDAFNYYNNWSDGDFPIPISGESNIVLLNEKLMPYFQKEPDYESYMAIRNKCTELGLFGFDGTAVYAPLVGKPVKNGNGYSFGINPKTGNKQVPKGWRDMVMFLRENYNIGVLSVDTSDPKCFFIKVYRK